VLTDDLPEDLVDHLIVEFGLDGERAVGFLRTAVAILAAEEAESPRRAECVAYALREAMTTLPQASGVPGGGEWRSRSRDVVDAKTRYEQVRDLPGADSDGALSELLASIESLAEIHDDSTVHQKRLLAVVMARTGAAARSDLVRDYQRLLDRVQRALHGSVALDAVAELCSECVTLLRRLFQPPDARRTELDRLAAIPDPGPTDVEEAMARLASSAHVVYFLARVVSPRWLELLEPSGLLDPPDGQAPWGVLPAVQRLGSSHPDALAALLGRIAAKYLGDARRLVPVVHAAQQLGLAGRELVLQSAQKHPEDSWIVFLLEQAALAAEADASFVQDAVDQVLNSARRSNVATYLPPILDHYVKGVTAATWHGRARLLCHKLRRTSDADRHYRDLVQFRAGSVTDSPQVGREDVFPSILRCLVDVLGKAAEFADLHSILDVFSDLPGPLRSRLRSWALSTWGDTEPALLLAEVAGAVSTRSPTGDDVTLVDAAVRKCDPEEYVESWKTALGVPPPVTEAGTALSAGAVPDDWEWAIDWIAILPSSVTGAWTTVDAMVAAARGWRPTREGLKRRPYVHAVWGGSPINDDDLRAMPPANAAQWIAVWHPQPDGRVSSARELGRSLESAVKNDPAGWAVAPLQTITVLREPVYIHHYLRGLAQAASLEGVPLSEIVDVILLTATSPWQPRDLGDSSFDYDPDWRGSVSAAVDLIAHLARRDTGFAGRDDEAWEFLLARAQDRDEGSGYTGGDPLTEAVNRACTRALEAVFTFMAHEYRASHGVRPAALDLLSQVITLAGHDGLQHRAIIAPRLGFLRHVAPEWFEDQQAVLFGDSAPEGLAQPTLDMSLSYGRPNAWLMQTYPAMLQDAIKRSVDSALDHYLIAMLWCVPGYAVDESTRRLQEMNALTSAGETLGRILAHDGVSAEQLSVGIEFWQQALQSGQDALCGFGWYAEITTLDQSTWADLTRRTLTATSGRIDWARHVAERAARDTPTPDVLEILNILVRRVAGDSWEQSSIIETAAQTISRADEPLSTTGEYQRLRTALLERDAEPAAPVTGQEPQG
jgi:hypothetical protein